MATESLTLKWGTIKGWHLQHEKSRDLMKQYIDLGVTLGAMWYLQHEKSRDLMKQHIDLGVTLGAMQQQDTPEQKKLICELIDAIDGPIENDWEGTTMTKDEAKSYVMNYGKS